MISFFCRLCQRRFQKQFHCTSLTKRLTAGVGKPKMLSFWENCQKQFFTIYWKTKQFGVYVWSITSISICLLRTFLPNSKKSIIVKKGVAHEWVWSLESKLQRSGISFSGSKLAESGQKSNSADKANDLNNSFPTNRNLSTCCWPREVLRCPLIKVKGKALKNRGWSDRFCRTMKWYHVTVPSVPTTNQHYTSLSGGNVSCFNLILASNFTIKN